MAFFDIGGSEILVIAVVAIVVVGPKDLPKMLRTAGQWVGKIKAIAGDFQRQFEEAMRQAELDDLKKEVENFAKMDPLEDIKKDVDDINRMGSMAAADTSLKPSPSLATPAGTAEASPAETANGAAAPPAPANPLLYNVGSPSKPPPTPAPQPQNPLLYSTAPPRPAPAEPIPAAEPSPAVEVAAAEKSR